MANDKKNEVDDIVKIPLDSIEANYEWNARSPWEKGNTDKTGHGFSELVDSLKENGQKRPCDVVKQKNGKYRLITGFRRFTAAKQLEFPTLLCVVRDWDEAKARLENVTENTEREDLRSSDTCWSIGQYVKTLKGERPSQEVLGKTFGLSQSYVSKHLQILDKVKPEILDAWRSGLPVGLKEGPRQDVGVLKFLSVAQVEPDRQAEQWSILLGIGPDGKKREKDPSEKAKGEAKRVGQLLGRLALAEVVDITGGFSQDLELFVPSASGLPKGAKTIVVGVLQTAFEAAKTQGATAAEGDSSADGESAEAN
jgi:ParB/RepB/Spo0J family partition protein